MQVEEAERLGVTRGGELLARGDQVVPGLERRRVGVESGVGEVRDVDRDRRAVELARQAVERAVLALSSREGAPDVAGLDSATDDSPSASGSTGASSPFGM